MRLLIEQKGTENEFSVSSAASGLQRRNLMKAGSTRKTKTVKHTLLTTLNCAMDTSRLTATKK